MGDPRRYDFEDRGERARSHREQASGYAFALLELQPLRGSARSAPAKVTAVKMHPSPNANRPRIALTSAVDSPMSRTGRARNAPRSGSSTISTSWKSRKRDRSG